MQTLIRIQIMKIQLFALACGAVTFAKLCWLASSAIRAYHPHAPPQRIMPDSRMRAAGIVSRQLQRYANWRRVLLLAVK